MERLTQRKDFILASQSPHVWKRPYFVLQIRSDTNHTSPRIGFTVTKRQGNAVIRNRIKRRLKEAVRLQCADIVRPNTDYVFIGRKDAMKLEFEKLQFEVIQAINRLQQKMAR